MVSLLIKLMIKLRKSEERHHKVIQKQLQMTMIKKIPKEGYTSPEEREKIIDDLRLI